MVRRTTLLSLCSVLLTGCGGDDASPQGGTTPDAGAIDSAAEVGADAQGEAGFFKLEVGNGFGSGSYAAGSTVHVWAELSPSRQLLTGWTGDDALLKEPREWHTTLVMPARDANVSATLEDIDTTLEVVDFKGTTTTTKKIRRLASPAGKGLMLLLHGTGGSSKLAEGPEARYLILAAYKRGYSVVAPEAEEVAAGDLNNDGKIRWNASIAQGNVDFANLDALVAELVQTGWLPDKVPLFSVGMSNGGATSISLGAVAAAPGAAQLPHLRFGAVVSYCASGQKSPAGITTTPSAWLLCAHDDNDEVSNADAHTSSESLGARGVATLIDEHPASPLYDERFLRADVDLAVSKALAADLRSKGWVDASSMFLKPSLELAAAMQAEPQGYPAFVALTGAQRSLVLDQIRVMTAEHQLYSDWANRTLDFLDQHAGVP